VVSHPVQWLLATCGWVFLEVVSSLMEACELQYQLHDYVTWMRSNPVHLLTQLFIMCLCRL